MCTLSGRRKWARTIFGESLSESERNSIWKAAIRHELVSKEEHDLLVKVRRTETEFNSHITGIKHL